MERCWLCLWFWLIDFFENGLMVNCVMRLIWYMFFFCGCFLMILIVICESFFWKFKSELRWLVWVGCWFVLVCVWVILFLLSDKLLCVVYCRFLLWYLSCFIFCWLVSEGVSVWWLFVWLLLMKFMYWFEISVVCIWCLCWSDWSMFFSNSLFVLVFW